MTTKSGPSSVVCPDYPPEYTISNDGTLGLAIHKLEKNPYRVQRWGAETAVRAEKTAFGSRPLYNDGCVHELRK